MDTMTARPRCPELASTEYEQLLATAASQEARGCTHEASRLRRIAAGMRGITTRAACTGQSGS